MVLDKIALDFAFGLVPVAWLGHDELRYLLIRHKKGHWGFPKGHKEGNESDLVAARREFEEETGVRQYEALSNVSFVERYQFRKKKGKRVNKTVKYFLATVPLVDEELPKVLIQAKEIRDFRWCSGGEAKALLSFGMSRQVLADCEQAIALLSPEALFR